MDNVKEWTSLPMPELLTMASRKKEQKTDLDCIIRNVPSTTHTAEEVN